MSIYKLRQLLGALKSYELQKDLACRMASRAVRVHPTNRRLHSHGAQNYERLARKALADILRQEGVLLLQSICDAQCLGGLTLANVRQLRGLAVIDNGFAVESLDAMGIAEFANLFLKANPLPPASGGYLGLNVNMQQRTISRERMRPEIDLSRSVNGWHIFENCWKARGANASEAVKNGYPNEISAIYRAVNALNKKLLTLKIKVDEFRLVDMGADDLTKM